MQIDVRSNIKEITRWLDDAQKKQIPFATAYSMTLTARDVAWEEIGVMQRVFDRPTPYALNALMVKPATTKSMVAQVEFKEGFAGTPAKRFLNPHVNGGARSQKSHELQLAPLLKGYSYVIPASGYPLNAYGNLNGGTLRKIISQLQVSRNADANASQSARSRAKRSAQAFFVSKRGQVIMERKGKAVRPALVGIRSPRYAKRFPFYETAAAVVRDRLEVNFEVAFQRAMATSGFKGKWGSSL
jgi:hypothetical protein